MATFVRKAVIEYSFVGVVGRLLGKRPGFYYNLVGDNGEILVTSEIMTQKHNIIEVIEKYFVPCGFNIQDNTRE